MASRPQLTWIFLLPAWLLLAAPPPLAAQETQRDVTLLEMRVIEGDGAVHRPGSRSSTPLTVQVTDQVGRPVAAVTVSFLMPGDGPAGIFASGLSTEVLSTGPDGRATIHGIRWGNATGEVRIRITARRGEARAGVISTQLIEAVEAGDRSTPGKRSPSVSKPRGKWMVIAIAAAGAAAGGLALGLAGGGGGSPPPIAGGVEQPATPTPTVQLGAPTISIGAP